MKHTYQLTILISLLFVMLTTVAQAQCRYARIIEPKFSKTMCSIFVDGLEEPIKCYQGGPNDTLCHLCLCEDVGGEDMCVYIKHYNPPPPPLNPVVTGPGCRFVDDQGNPPPYDQIEEHMCQPTLINPCGL